MKIFSHCRSRTVCIRSLYFVMLILIFQAIWILSFPEIMELSASKGNYPLLNPWLISLSVACGLTTLWLLKFFHFEERARGVPTVYDLCISFIAIVYSPFIVFFYFNFSPQVFAWAVIATIMLIALSAVPFLLCKKKASSLIVSVLWLFIVGIVVVKWLIPSFALNLSSDGIAFLEKFVPTVLYVFLGLCFLTIMRWACRTPNSLP